MPLRFQRQFKAGPFRLNFSKRGVSFSAGTKGAWYTAGNSHQRVSIGAPGSGLQWYRQRPLPQSASSALASALRSLAFIIAAIAIVALFVWH